jgi:hypothetical protein
MRPELRSLIVFLIPMMFAPVALHSGQASAPLTLHFQEKQGHFDIQAQFEAEAQKDTVWETLTDFESYSKYSHELKKIRILEHTPAHWKLEEVAESGFLFITQKVFFLLDIKAVPGRSLISEDLDHRSFVSYRTEWGIKPSPEGPGTQLSYHLKAEGHFGGPAFIVNDSFQGGVKNFLEAIRKEMKRRQTEKDKKHFPSPSSLPAKASP